MTTTNEAGAVRAERTFLQGENVLVTNARLVIEGHTFAMANLTSVRAVHQKQRWFWGVVWLFFAAIAVVVKAWPGAIALGVLCVGYLLLRRGRYNLVVTTSSSEQKAMSAYQRGPIDRVVDAVNQAIVARG